MEINVLPAVLLKHSKLILNVINVLIIVKLVLMEMLVRLV